MKKTVIIGVDPFNPEAAKVTYYSVCSHLDEASDIDVKFMNPLDLMRERKYHKETLIDSQGLMFQTSHDKKERIDVLHRKCRFYTPFIAPKGLSLFLTDKLLVRDNIALLFEEYLKGDPYMISCVKYGGTKYEYGSDVLLFDTMHTNLTSVLDIKRIPSQWVSGINSFAWVNLNKVLRDQEIGELDPKWNWVDKYCNNLVYPNSKIINFTDMAENQDYLDEKFMYVFNDLTEEYKKLSTFN